MLISLASQVALVIKMVKNPPANAGDIRTWVWPLGREYPLEEEMATHCSILAWEIPRTEEPGGLQSMGLQRVERDWAHTQGRSNTLEDARRDVVCVCVCVCVCPRRGELESPALYDIEIKNSWWLALTPSY